MAVTDFQLMVSSSVQADSPNTLSLKGAVADGASAVGVILDNTVTLSNASSRLLKVLNNNILAASIGPDGSFYSVGGGYNATGTTVYLGNNNNSINLNNLGVLSGNLALTLGTSASNSSVTLLGNRSAADAGADIVLNTVATRSAGHLLEIRNNTVVKAYMASNGDFLTVSDSYANNFYANSTGLFHASGALTVGGLAADGPTAVGVIVKAAVAFADAGSKLVSIRNATVEKAYIDKDGNYITSGDIGNLLYGKPTWVGTVVTAAGVPVSTASTAVPFTLTAGSVYFVQPDVSCYLEVIAAGSMTLAGAKSVVLEALEKYYFQVKTGSLVYSFDVASGGANIKFFQMS